MFDPPPMLPGFDPEAMTASDSGLGAAARATLDALQAAGRLDAKHALSAQMLLAVATRAGKELQAPATTIATTNLLRLAADLLDRLPVDDAGDLGDETAAFLKAIAEADAAARRQ